MLSLKFFPSNLLSAGIILRRVVPLFGAALPLLPEKDDRNICIDLVELLLFNSHRVYPFSLYCTMLRFVTMISLNEDTYIHTYIWYLCEFCRRPLINSQTCKNTPIHVEQSIKQSIKQSINQPIKFYCNHLISTHPYL